MAASKNLTAEQRRQRAKLAAHVMHSKNSPREITKAATEAAKARFRRQVEEETPGLDPAEVERRVRHLQQADMYRLALLSSKARAAQKAPADG